MTMADTEKVAGTPDPEKCDEKLLSEIDKTLEQYFEILDSLYRERAQLNTFMKEGFFMMSKARYSMGVKSVSQLQYDENNMIATAKVKVENDDMEMSEEGTPFELLRSSLPNNKKNKGNKEEAMPKSSSEVEGLRRRTVKKEQDLDGVQTTTTTEGLSEQFEKLNTGQVEQDDEDDDQQRVVDPIKWFGVLVPQALKTGQNCFVRATETVCHLASLQHRLEDVRKKYIKLIQEKANIRKTLIDKSSD